MFLLVCAAGMSTSLLVNRMKEAAETKEIEFQIEAHPVGQIEKYGEAADDILLGPQVKYMYEETVEQFGSQGIPIAVIDQGDYGMMNGEKVLKSAIRLIKANK